jgi:hypothetical protein
MFSARIMRKGGADAIVRRVLKSTSGPTKVKVGFVAGETSADIIARATYNEFGTSRIPERPFMRTALRENRPGYNELRRADARKILRGEMLLSTALRRIGWKARDDIKAMIESSMDPVNAPSTVKQKGHARTLIDTGVMHRAVTYKIEDE